MSTRCTVCRRFRPVRASTLYFVCDRCRERCQERNRPLRIFRRPDGSVDFTPVHETELTIEIGGTSYGIERHTVDMLIDARENGWPIVSPFHEAVIHIVFR